MAAPATPAELREKANRYRALAIQITDERTMDALLELANEYDEMADRLDMEPDDDRAD